MLKSFMCEFVMGVWVWVYSVSGEKAGHCVILSCTWLNFVA